MGVLIAGENSQGERKTATGEGGGEGGTRRSRGAEEQRGRGAEGHGALICPPPAPPLLCSSAPLRLRSSAPLLLRVAPSLLHFSCSPIASTVDTIDERLEPAT